MIFKNEVLSLQCDGCGKFLKREIIDGTVDDFYTSDNDFLIDKATDSNWIFYEGRTSFHLCPTCAEIVNRLRDKTIIMWTTYNMNEAGDND